MRKHTLNQRRMLAAVRACARENGYRRPWEVAGITGLPLDYVEIAMRQLVARGQLVPVRGGVDVVGAPRDVR